VAVFCVHPFCSSAKRSIMLSELLHTKLDVALG